MNYILNLFFFFFVQVRSSVNGNLNYDDNSFNGTRYKLPHPLPLCYSNFMETSKSLMEMSEINYC